MSETQSITLNIVLNNVKDRYLEMIDSSDDVYVNTMKNKMLSTLSNMTVQYDEYHGQFYQDYSEVTLYLILKHNDLDITPLARKSYSTPDFRIVLAGKDYFVENKCLMPMNTVINMAGLQEQMLEVNIELEEKSKKKGVHFGAPIVCQPHRANTEKYSHNANLLVIDNIIRKVVQNCKSSQLSKNTILMIDMTHLPLHHRPTSSAFIYLGSDELVYTAPLWISCFGKIGTPVFGVKEFPLGNFEGYMEIDGIFNSINELNAIAFRFDDWTGDSVFIGFDRYGFDMDRLIQSFCKESNNDRNRHCFPSLM
jgi:hypothetical protein